MQKFIILSTLSIWFAQSLCQIKKDAPEYLYPSMDSLFTMNMEEFISDTNLQFSLSDVNSTYYYSFGNSPQQIQLNGIIIASSQYAVENKNSFYIEGNIALLVQNSTGYYSYLISTNQQSYTINLIGNLITNNIVCYSISFQNSTILVVSCLNKLQTQIIAYDYDLFNQSFLQPTPYWTNMSLQNITNIITNSEQQIYDTFACTSSIINQTTIFQYYYRESFIYQQNYTGYLTDMIGYQFLLFINQLQYNYGTFEHSGYMFLKMSIINQIREQVLISTQKSILILELLFQHATLIDEIPYPQGFQLGIDSKVQLFSDDQYIIISDSYTFLVYQQSNQKLFWQYQLQQQSLIQYDNINKIITIITSQSIQAFQLFKPQIYLYFNQIISGMLNIIITGLNKNCSFQLEYQVVLNNDAGPYVNQDDDYQELNYQESQIQCMSCLFTGSNLTYNAQTFNIQSKYYSVELKNQFSKSNFQFYYIYLNPVNPQQYAIFYQLENSYDLYVIYCGTASCFYISDYETLNQTAILTLNGTIYSFVLQFLEIQYPKYITFMLTFNIYNQFNNYYSCTFGWQYMDFECYTNNIEIQLPPDSIIKIELIGVNTYFQISNPYFIPSYYNVSIVQNIYQFVPRQIFSNQQLYNNLLFIDNVFQLNIYELILNGTYLTFVRSIQYPLQQGNTSVGVGLLEKAIVITQIDDQGNQYILFFDPIIIRPINLIQQPQPLRVQIPSGAQIQFPIVCSYTNTKFYLALQYNQNNEIAVLQASSTINNMLLTSIYINGQINSIQTIGQGIYDILLCQYNQSKIIQITVQNQFFIQLNSNLLLQNDTFNNVSIFYQAQYQQQQVQIIKQYTFINEIFKITQTQQYREIQVNNSLWFKFQMSDYYQGLVNIYKSNNNQQSPLGPFIVSNNFVKVNPVPQLFISNPSLSNGFDIYFQNNSGVYQISNFLSGQIQQITQFAENLNCPIFYQYINIISICQSSPTELIVYSNTVQNFTLDQPLNLVNGLQLDGIIVLNYGQSVQLIINNQVICEYNNSNITITNVYIQQQGNYLIILQIQNSNIIIILEYYVNERQKCFPRNQNQLWIDSNRFGKILYLNAQNYGNFLTVTTTKISIIYEYNIETYDFHARYLISYSQEMIGIQTKVIDNYVVAIYNTTVNDQLNYTVIVYSLQSVNNVDLPIIAYYNQFPSSSQIFYICEGGTLVYTYIDQGQTGFSYLQVLPYVYVAIDYNNLTLISQNNTYAINNYISQVSAGNQFNQVNITFNITYNNYIGVKQNGPSSFGNTNLILVIISALSIIGFVSFVAYKIQTRSKME